MENTVKKITKVMKFDAITAMLKGETPKIEFSIEEAVDFLANERAMVVAKNARKSTTDSKTQKENKALLPSVLAALEAFPDGAQCKELLKHVDGEKIATTQKLSGLLGMLCDAGSVEKRTEKGVTRYFPIASEVEG